MIRSIGSASFAARSVSKIVPSPIPKTVTFRISLWGVRSLLLLYSLFAVNFQRLEKPTTNGCLPAVPVLSDLQDKIILYLKQSTYTVETVPQKFQVLINAQWKNHDFVNHADSIGRWSIWHRRQ